MLLKKFSASFLLFIALVYFVGWVIVPRYTDVVPDERAERVPVGINQLLDNSYSELPQTEHFERTVNRFLAEWQITGASFALMKNGKLLYSKGFGYADKEAGVKSDVKHIFRIASVSKLITALAVMKLSEEGKLLLSDRVFGEGGILSDSIFTVTDKRVLRITVEHLLRHEAGFSSRAFDPMFTPLEVASRMGVEGRVDLMTMVRFAAQSRLRFAPGEGATYSNLGYAVLAKVIEQASGQEYEKYVQNHILHPTGCYDMHIAHNLYEDKFPNEVRYYEQHDAELVEAYDGSGKLVPKAYGGNDVEGLSGAGGWVASPTELLKLVSMVDYTNQQPSILSKKSIDYMAISDKKKFPIGWIRTSEEGTWSRTGTMAGTSALLKRERDGYTWIFITNTSSWLGSRFPSRVNTMITRALSSVSELPERDLFNVDAIN